MNIDLSGRTALITGGSRGLGLAMARRFAGSGADVVLLARRAEVLEEAVAGLREATHTRVEGFPCDVADAADIERTWRRVGESFAAIDILVNNAGKSQAGPFAEQTDAIWQGDLDLKLMAAVRLSRLALPGMVARRWGRIINVLNTAAKAPGARSAPTSVSRAAGLALTKVLANEYAPHNICVNAMLIGLIKSDQWVRRWQAGDRAEPLEAFFARLGKNLPMGRIGESEECANLATFLASDAASYVTGCAINMDGGLSPVP